MAVTLAYLTSAQDTANATTYNGAGYQGLSFGTEDATRYICIGIAGIASSAPNSAISSVTIGGVAATQFAASAGLSGGGVFEFWYAAVPTGTTGDVSVTYGEAQVRSIIHLWSVIGSSGTPVDGDWANAGGANQIQLSTVTVPDGGCGMWFGFVGNTGDIVWTNADERYDASWESANGTGAADTTTAGTPTITMNGANSSGHNISGIAWESAPAAYTLAADAGSYALTGTAATPKHGFKIAAAAGSYALTGTAATPKHNWKIAAAAGSYALSGTAASPEIGFKVAAAGGSYALTGSDVTLTLSGGGAFLLGADAGSYALSGTDAATRHAWKIAADAGSYALSGTAATPKHAWKAPASAGSYALSGTAASPEHGWMVAAAAGSYALTGSAVTAKWAHKLAAESGSYLLDGQDVAIRTGVEYDLAADAGAYVLTGMSISFITTNWRTAPIRMAGSITGSAALSGASPNSTKQSGSVSPAAKLRNIIGSP